MSRPPQPNRATVPFATATIRKALAATLLPLAAACGGEEATGLPNLQPDLIQVAPDSGNVGTRVVLSGSSLQPGASVTFGSLRADSVEFVSATSLVAYAPGGIEAGQAYDVEVRNPGGKRDAIVGAWRGVAPTLLSVNGVSKPTGNTGSTVILEGRAFGDLLGVGHVFFTDAGGSPVEATITLPDNWTNDFIVTTVPGAAATGPVWVETPTGTTDSVEFRLVQNATFSPSLINWSSTAALPDSSQGHRVVFLNIESGAGAGRLVYVTGGADGAMTARSRTAWSEVDGSSQLSAWTEETALPAPRAFHASVAATPFNALVDTLPAGHLYVVGGVDGAGSPTTTVYRSVIGRDRTLGAWNAETPLPQPLHSMGAVVYRSWLYVVGGATSGNAPAAATYRARIEADGSLGPWESQTPLPYARAYAPLVQFAGVLYVMGGDTSSVGPADGMASGNRVAQIHLNRLAIRTAELQGWSVNPSNLIKAVAKHSAIVNGGWLLVSGGLYNGAPNSATEHQYAAFNADGTLSSFNGATGSQTIAESGGIAFFNHAAVTYADANDAAHVLMLGGNDVNDTATPVPDSWFY